MHCIHATSFDSMGDNGYLYTDFHLLFTIGLTDLLQFITMQYSGLCFFPLFDNEPSLKKAVYCRALYSVLYCTVFMPLSPTAWATPGTRTQTSVSSKPSAWPTCCSSLRCNTAIFFFLPPFSIGEISDNESSLVF